MLGPNYETHLSTEPDRSISKPCLVETKLYNLKFCTNVSLSSLQPQFPFVLCFGSTDGPLNTALVTS